MGLSFALWRCRRLAAPRRKRRSTNALLGRFANLPCLDRMVQAANDFINSQAHTYTDSVGQARRILVYLLLVHIDPNRQHHSFLLDDLLGIDPIELGLSPAVVGKEILRQHDDTSAGGFDTAFN